VKIGNIGIHLVNDGTFMMDGGVVFGQIPKSQWELHCKPDRRNRVRLSLNALLVQTPDKNLLIDTGAGGKRMMEMRADYSLNGNKLIRNLKFHGLTARDIDIVALTNLHFDHSGGCTKLDRGGAPVPMFPNATYMMQEASWDAAVSHNARYNDTFFEEDYGPLEDNDQVMFLNGEEEIVPGFVVKPMDGPSQGNQVVFLSYGSERIVYAGDLIPTPFHLTPHYIQADAEFPNDTLVQKSELVNMAMEDGWLVVFGHGFECAAGYIQNKNGRLHLEAVNM